MSTLPQARVLSFEETEDFCYISSKCSRWSPVRTISPPEMASYEHKTLVAIVEGHYGQEPLVRNRSQHVVDLRTQQRSQFYDMNQSCMCPQEWIDQTSIELHTTPLNTVTMSRSSSHTSMTNDLTAMGCFSDAFLQLDAADWPQCEISTCETPPYSSDIYASSFPGNDYDVDLNVIDLTFDCDISTLDSYLHSPSCSSTNLLRPQPSSSVSTHLSSTEQSPDFDKNVIEEFFPDICHASKASVVQQTSRRPSHSTGNVTTTTRFSPYSRSSPSSDSWSDYREKRYKNNIASQRSRRKRAEKQREMRKEKEMLEMRNVELKTLLGSLEVQVADYKHIILMVMSKLRS